MATNPFWSKDHYRNPAWQDFNQTGSLRADPFWPKDYNRNPAVPDFNPTGSLRADPYWSKDYDRNPARADFDPTGSLRSGKSGVTRPTDMATIPATSFMEKVSVT